MTLFANFQKKKKKKKRKKNDVSLVESFEI